MTGRKYAFNCSLFICSVFAIVAGASPNWYALGFFVSAAAFGAGGNLVLDTSESALESLSGAGIIQVPRESPPTTYADCSLAVFLEFLPGRYQWLLTLLACWWGLAPVIGAGFAWPLLSLPQFICAEGADPCRREDNMVSRKSMTACTRLT
jgi:MFS family permease